MVRFGPAVNMLWNPLGDGPFDNRFQPWASLRANRNLKDCTLYIIKYFSNNNTEYPSQLQVLAKRLSNEREDVVQEHIQRTNTDHHLQQTRQAENDFREGALGLLPAGIGVRIPSLEDDAEIQRAQAAATMLGQRTASQNNTRECQKLLYPN